MPALTSAGDSTEITTSSGKQSEVTTKIEIAINGEINSADVYVSNHLFAKLWPRMLKAAAVEAVAEGSRGGNAPAPKPASIEAFISEAEKGRAKERTTSGKSKVITKENDGSTVFEARDKADLVVHRNYVKVN